MSNKQLYKKYYVSGQKLQISVDYYYMTESMWKFLFSIYGGGPIMKKKKSSRKTVSNPRLQSNNFEQTPESNLRPKEAV